MARHITQRQSVSSASRVPSVSSPPKQSFVGSADISPYQLPVGNNGNGYFGRFNGSAPAPNGMAQPAPEATWRDMYVKGQELLEQAQQLWKKEREKLTAEIEQLQRDLMITKTKLRQQELAAEDPDHYITKVISNGRSRSESTQSSTSQNATPTKMPPPIIAMTYGSPGPLGNGTNRIGRLPSIQETERSPRSSTLERSASVQARRKPQFHSLDSALSSGPARATSLSQRRREGESGVIHCTKL